MAVVSRADPRAAGPLGAPVALDGGAAAAPRARIAAIALATGCGAVDDVRLPLPDDLRFPVAVLHAYAEGGGPLYVAERRADLDALQIFARPDDTLFVVEVEPTFDPSVCPAFDLKVFCSVACFPDSSIRPRLVWTDGGLENPNRTRTSIVEKLECSGLIDVRCDSCFRS